MGRYPQRGGTDIRKKSNLEAIAVAEKTRANEAIQRGALWEKYEEKSEKN